jgi:ABC-type branched-subunit amino acid transport system ATPase component
MQVLDGFDLSVGRGEVVALMGANGAGKSTLAKIASGVFQPDRGRIFVAGREVRLASPRAAREAGIVIVHQSTDQLGVPGLSVAENLLHDGLCAGGIGAFFHKRLIHGWWSEAPPALTPQPIDGSISAWKSESGKARFESPLKAAWQRGNSVL